MGRCILDSLRINAELMTVYDIARYKNSLSPSTVRLSNGGFTKYSLRLWKVDSHSSIQWKAYLWVLNNGRHLVVAFETNLFIVATRPISLCTSLTVLGEVMSSIALTFSGFSSILHCDTMKPRNFTNKTLKTHFSGLSFILYLLKVSNVSWRFARWV